MKGDFTRDTFDSSNHFSRVLMQQGRVQLDADWNEGSSIILHTLRALAADLIGPYGGPEDIEAGGATTQVNCGFEIITAEARIDNLEEYSDDQQKKLKDLLKESKPPILVGIGHYYVDGILCESPKYIPYASQPGYPFLNQPEKFDPNKPHLLYLDIWERHLTYAEMEDREGNVISIREVALNGPDTATRAQVVWQVKSIDHMPDDKDITATADKPGLEKLLSDWVAEWQPPNRGMLKARAIKPESSDLENHCITPPELRYRGAENQLYRVEIHQGGSTAEGASFKWSRENGSVIFPIHKLGSTWATVWNLGRDERLGLQADDWLEAVDDDYTLQNRAAPLVQVASIVSDIDDPELYRITFKTPLPPGVGQNPAKHPLLRRWDQRETQETDLTDGVIAIVEAEPGKDENWIELEDGIDVQFQRGEPGEPRATYRTGDYWLIPARVITGDVEWPGPKDDPKDVSPHGITHHYAPLWLLSFDMGTVKTNIDLRRKFHQTRTV